MKPGWQTSEFWLTSATTIIGFGVSIGLVSVADAATLTSAVTQSVTAVATIAGAVTVILSYINSRTKQKVAGK